MSEMQKISFTYLHTLQQKSTRNLFILIFLLAAVIARIIHIALYNLETMGCICCYDTQSHYCHGLIGCLIVSSHCLKYSE